MNTDELKKLAEAATPIETELYGDRYFQGPFSCATLNKEQDAYIAAANPAAILKLLQINAELVEALRSMVSLVRRNAPELSGKVLGYADAALAKAEGGEL